MLTYRHQFWESSEGHQSDCGSRYLGLLHRECIVFYVVEAYLPNIKPVVDVTNQVPLKPIQIVNAISYFIADELYFDDSLR